MNNLPNVSFSEQNKNKKTRKWKSIGTIILVPNLLMSGYFYFIARPMYVAHSTLLISNPAKDASTMSSIMSGTPGSSNAGAYVFKEFVHGTPEYKTINREFNLNSLYSSTTDLVRGYGGLTSLFEKNDVSLKKYYISHTPVKIDSDSGLVSMQVIAPTEATSRSISDTIIADVKTHIASMNAEEEKDFTSAALADVQKAKNTLLEDEANLTKFRLESGIYDPKTFYGSLMDKIQDMEVKNVTLQGQYNFIVRDTPNNPVASQYSTQMNAFKKEIKDANTIISNHSESLTTYDSLILKQKVDSALLQSAEMALQKSEIQDSQNHYYLKVIESSQTLDTPERPYSSIILGCFFVLTLVLFAIFG